MSGTEAAAPAAADPAAAAAAQEPQPKTEAQLWDELQASKRKPEDAEPEPSASAAADQTGDGKAKKEEPKPADAAAAKSELDIWASATPEQRAAYQAATQKARSNSGRISALQRKINTLQANAPKQGETRPKARDTIAPLKDDFPDIAAPLEKLAGQVDDRQAADDAAREAELADTIQQLETDIDAEEAILASAHSDWKSMFEGPEGQKTKDQLNYWLQNIAPVRIFDLAVKNANAITDAAGAIETLDAFKKYRATLPQAAPAQAAAAAAAPAASAPPQQQTPATQPKPDDKRQMQLAATAAPAAGLARATVSAELPAEGDGEAMWAQLQADKLRKRAALAAARR